MRCCCLCKRKDLNGNGSFFTIPKDERRKSKWSEICQVKFTASSFICSDHFAPSDIVKGRRTFLMPIAVPCIDVMSKRKAFNDDAPQNICFENENGESVMPPQLEEEPTIEIPVIAPHLQEDPIIDIPVIPPELQRGPVIEIPATKSFSCAGSAQTNTRLCGLVEALELSGEFHLNCFYCSETFPLEKWKNFADHLTENHFEMEEKIKNCRYVSEEHDYTSTDLTLSRPAETVSYNSKSHLSHLEDPMEPTNRNCLKTMNATTEEELEAEEEYKTDSIEIVQQKPTEISFEYTPRDIVDLLLDSMKSYPVLWQFDDEPFNEDFYEAVEDLCKIINDIWSLNITNLKMRRSINRILRFYCYLYPNDNIEDIHQFTCYYDKCATFLPTSANDIAYARCSHCYKCYKCDFDLKPHLLEEYKKLQWPYKCVQCKECFIECDEYQFHKCLPHYREVFRCEPCNKKFFRRNVYNKHVSDKHPKEAKYKCDVCEKLFKNRTYLRNHKRIHGEKKRKCHLCPKSYCDTGAISLHLKWHRRQYDFMCEICGEKLLTQASLRVHMKKHTQEKVTCNICNLKLRKSSLNRHLELLHVAYEGTLEQTLKGRHTNYRRFVKSSPFRQRKKYSEKKYDCKICKISLNYDSVLQHIKEFHPDITKWSCKMCVMDFSLKRHLKRHYRRRHKLELLQINKLVEENQDISVVLPYNNNHLDALAKTSSFKCKQNNARKSNIKTSIKSDLLADELCFVEEKNNSSNIQDVIMNAADYIMTEDDFFTEFLEDP